MPRKASEASKTEHPRKNRENQSMKIVITSEGTSLESQVDSRFGRTKHFVLVDTDTGEFSAHNNTQNLNAMQGRAFRRRRPLLDWVPRRF